MVEAEVIGRRRRWTPEQKAALLQLSALEIETLKFQIEKLRRMQFGRPPEIRRHV